MSKQKAKGLTSSFLQPLELATDGGQEKPVAMTLKLPHELYVRLRNLAAIKKSKGQAIMLQAVTEYLDRIEG